MILQHWEVRNNEMVVIIRVGQTDSRGTVGFTLEGIKKEVISLVLFIFLLDILLDSGGLTLPDPIFFSNLQKIYC